VTMPPEPLLIEPAKNSGEFPSTTPRQNVSLGERLSRAGQGLNWCQRECCIMSRQRPGRYWGWHRAGSQAQYRPPPPLAQDGIQPAGRGEG